MKKFVYTLICSLISLSVAAQGFEYSPVGLIKDYDGYILSYPSTTIDVELLIETEVVTPGIYSRYAQKFLAQRAPLVAQTICKVVDASISVNNLGNQATKTIEPKAAHVEYSTLPADQYSLFVLPIEDAARDAAAAIFTIRRQRRDIINGEAGEGYFGGGLQAAIENLDKMEQEYLELFMGSRTITQSKIGYTINPQEGTTRYVIARFDSKVGVMSANDLSGTPIYIQFTPQEMADTKEIEATEKSRHTILYKVAAPTQCTLFNDAEEISSSLLSIYQFGKDIKIDRSKAQK